MANWSLSYTNPRNQGIDLHASPFGISSIEGLEIPGGRPQSQQAPFQDGVTFLSTTYEPRLITVTLGMLGPYSDANYYAARRQLSNLLNMSLHANGDLGLLTYTDANVTREIPARVDSVQMPQVRRDRSNQEFVITFECPDPLLRDPVENEETIETVVAVFEFPDGAGGLEFDDVGGGIELDEYLVGEPINLLNEGDVDCPVLLTFYGPADDPKIENQTTGEYIEFTLALDTGDTLTIDTEAKTVVYYDASGPTTTNGNQYLVLASSFWYLMVGDNDVQFTTGDSSTSARCSVAYKERYVSI